MDKEAGERNSEKSVFEFDDYRRLLRHLYAKHKAQDKGFSYRSFSRRAGFVSPNFLKRVMDGESNLSLVSIEKFIKGFKLGREEATFFKHLVLFNQAKNSKESQHHAEEIMRIRSYRAIHPLKDSQYRLFSNWYFIPVRELVRFPDFREDPEWIARTIVPSISPEQAKLALDELFKLGLLERNSEGKIIQKDSHLSTPDEVVSTSLVKCHKDMMAKASESIDRFPRDKRDISSVTFGMPKERIQEVKEIVSKFRKELLEMASTDRAYDSVYQLNIQFFPLALSRSDEQDEKEDI